MPRSHNTEQAALGEADPAQLVIMHCLTYSTRPHLSLFLQSLLNQVYVSNAPNLSTRPAEKAS